jgi:hypothetical protein
MSRCGWLELARERSLLRAQWSLSRALHIGALGDCLARAGARRSSCTGVNGAQSELLASALRCKETGRTAGLGSCGEDFTGDLFIGDGRLASGNAVTGRLQKKTHCALWQSRDASLQRQLRNGVLQRLGQLNNQGERKHNESGPNGRPRTRAVPRHRGEEDAINRASEPIREAGKKIPRTWLEHILSRELPTRPAAVTKGRRATRRQSVPRALASNTCVARTGQLHGLLMYKAGVNPPLLSVAR